MDTSEKSNEQLMELYKQTGELWLKQELTMRYIYLLKIIARQMRNVYNSFSDMDDIINEGIIVLMEAIDNFDPQKNVKFESYASLRIRGMVIDIARRQDWVPRSVRRAVGDIDKATASLYESLGRYPTDDEVAKHMGIPTEKYLKLLAGTGLCNVLSLNAILTDTQFEVGMATVGGGTPQDVPEAAYQAKESAAQLAQAIDNLKENEKRVISMYYNDEISIKDIAEALSLSQSRVSQIHSKALFKLRHTLQNQSV